MKKTIIALMIMLPSLVNGQDKKFELGFSVGNNGMFKEIQDFYYDYNYQIFFFEPVESKAFDLKYTLSARYFISENVSARLKFGYSSHKVEYEQGNRFYYGEEYEINQKVFNVNPSVSFSKNLDKIEIMTGIEIPFILIGDYSIKTQSEPDSLIYIYGPLNSYESTISGGFIFGISSFIGLKYNFNNWIALGSEMNFGLMFANVGDEVSVEYNDGYDNFTESYEAGLKQTYFSSPEFSLGLFVKFGGTKKDAPVAK